MPKHQSCEKGVAPLKQKKQGEKVVKSKVAAKNGCDGRLRAKNLITIQVNMLPPAPISPECFVLNC